MRNSAFLAFICFAIGVAPSFSRPSISDRCGQLFNLLHLSVRSTGSPSCSKTPHDHEPSNSETSHGHKPSNSETSHSHEPSNSETPHGQDDTKSGLVPPGFDVVYRDYGFINPERPPWLNRDGK
ncbi:hypothetical protein F5148DRAFT_1223732 [Russula earlei]|uniref:Uncharacterized protein n=1 Tax=Russula earlei TaxID=71964 RepID=A0ACC0U0Y4_9AGAM|nr:hypothetical protein F5148DRAFT_1223732 [Russula earlei]